MKKLAIFGAVVLVFAMAVPVLAGAKNATYLEWTWPAGVHKSGYFMRTGSGIVQAWTYGHPDLGDARFIFKPLDKFKNAAVEGCDEGFLRENTNWHSQNLWQVMDTAGYKTAFDEIFVRPATYLFCAYSM